MTTQDAVAGGSGNSMYPVPVPNASLLLSFRPTAKKVLILGTKRLAASRIFSILEADAIPVVVGTDSHSASDINEEVQWRISQKQCQYISPPPSDSSEEWSSLMDLVDGSEKSLFAVCVTDTLHAGDDEVGHEISQNGNHVKTSPLARARRLASICKSKRIFLNVADQPSLCDYSFPASHRFTASPSPLSALDANSLLSSSSTTSLSAVPFTSSLQIAVTTNGKGCRLAGRIRREIVSKLPKNVGDAVERVGEMRNLAKRKHVVEVNGSKHANDHAAPRSKSLRRTAIKQTAGGGVEEVQEDDLSFDSTPINSPVSQLGSSTGGDGFFAQVNSILRSEQDELEERKRRMRWVAQMSEYWPIEYLGSLTAADMAKALDTYADKKDQQLATGGEETPRGRTSREAKGSSGEDSQLQAGSSSIMSRRGSSQHSLSLDRPRRPKQTAGHIFLVGSGTGHPGLLTTFAHRLLTSTDTDLILSDKLVPSSILSLIPESTPLQIARKFPGNAEGAQSELISLALQAALEGKRVIRLKQGDPFVYGRGGEEVLAFQKAGVQATVVPGISSALAAPLMLGIPVTQRGAADSLTLCTGVGRGGKSVRLPGYERSRSLIVLMGVARLKDVVKTLCHGWQSANTSTSNASRQHPNAVDDTPAGQRVGDAFPPYTPIAIIERASSSDQRLVASTLDCIESALARSGEQRPPGMMLIGWAALALHGHNGNVDVLDDEEQCFEDRAELERRDRSRIQSWLGEKGYLVKEGLDEFYSRYLTMFDGDDVLQDSSAVTSLTHADVNGKGPSGWAPPRYGEDGPRGGWGHSEKELPPTSV